MNADLILKSDLIDLIFESRNKDYGAYELRKLYRKHLLIAICGPVLLLIFAWWLVGRNGDNVLQTITKTPATDNAEFVIQPPPHAPLPPLPIARTNRNAASAEIEFNTPVISNNVETDVPETGELVDAIIGTKTADPVGDPAPPVQSVGAAAEAPTNPVPAVYESVEQMPEFPGGVHALSRFFSKHLRVPLEIDEPGTRVRVLVHFVVDRDGSLKSVQFKDSVQVVYENEIRRVFEKMPKWNPGSQHGKLVSVYYHLPIIFEIPEQ